MTQLAEDHPVSQGLLKLSGWWQLFFNTGLYPPVARETLYPNVRAIGFTTAVIALLPESI